jgi:hypothetical protein
MPAGILSISGPASQKVACHARTVGRQDGSSCAVRAGTGQSGMLPCFFGDCDRASTPAYAARRSGADACRAAASRAALGSGAWSNLPWQGGVVYRGLGQRRGRSSGLCAPVRSARCYRCKFETSAWSTWRRSIRTWGGFARTAPRWTRGASSSTISRHAAWGSEPRRPPAS